MTNENSDIQHALYPRNVMVRGGRLTKFKGRVASIAPGLLVATTVAALFTGSAAQAQTENECGPSALRVVTCDVKIPSYSSGINYIYNGATELKLILNDSRIIVNNQGATVQGESDGDVSVHMGAGDIYTTANLGDGAGLFANTVGAVSANATVQMDGGRVTTEGDNAVGLHALIRSEAGSGAATVRMTGGTVTTKGLGARGLHARAVSDNAATVEMNGGRVTTERDNAVGLFAQISNNANQVTADNNASTVKVSITENTGRSTVTTKGTGAHGLLASTVGLGAAIAEMDGGTVTTKGKIAHGLFAVIDNDENEATATARITKGNIDTGTGSLENEDASYGVYASTNGLGAALAQMEGGTVTTSNRGGHALYARATGAGDATAQMTGGKIVSYNQGAYAIYAEVGGAGTALAEMEGGEVETKLGAAHGLHARNNNNSLGDAIAQMTGGKIVLRGDTSTDLTSAAYGIWAYVFKPMSAGEAKVRITGESTIETADNFSFGLRAETHGSGAATAEMEGGTVSTEGDNAVGLFALNVGLGAVTVEMDGGRVTTEGNNAVGLHAQISTNNTVITAVNNASTVKVRITEDTGKSMVETEGAGAHGLWASTVGKGAAIAEMDGGTVTTEGEEAHGLFAEIDNDASLATATARMTDGEVNTSGDSARGLWARTEGFGDAVAQLEGGTVTTRGGRAEVASPGVGFKPGAYGLWAQISNGANGAEAKVEMTGEATVITEGESAHGLLASTNGAGAATVEMDGGTVTTEKKDAFGLLAATAGAGDALTQMKDGTVTTKGDQAFGLAASTNGAGAATVEMEGGKVTTTGERARGLFAQILAGDSRVTATARLTNGDVNTGGDAAHGLLARTEGDAAALTQMEGGTVTAKGDQAYGLAATTSATGAATVEMEGGTVTMTGEQARGLFAQSAGGQAVVDVGAKATVTVSGTGSDGIHAEGAQGFDVNVAGHVTGGADAGAAIRTISGADGGGTIDIADTATVTAGAAGLAIQGEGGDTVITSAGSITGDIRLGAGDDTLELTGGSFTGDIYTGAGNDSVTISAATIYDGSILDGGEGDNDRLTLGGQTMTSIENVINWEHLTLSDTKVNLAGLATLDMGLSVDAGSVFSASGGEGGTPSETAIAGRVTSASGGGMTIRGDVTNDGDLTLSVQDGKTGDVITIQGDYTGSEVGSGVFALDARMDSRNTDKLVIEGNTSGDMMLSIATLGSTGAAGGPLEIDVVSVGGASNGTFTLIDGNYVTPDGEHAVIAGAYLYRLAETGDGWALNARSATGEVNYQPSAPVYDSYGPALLAMNGPASLHARGSSQDFRSLAWDGGSVDQNTDSPLWVQMGGDRITSSEEHSTTGAALKSNLWEMEVGADIVLSDVREGLLVGGLMFSYATGSTDVSSAFGDGSIDTSGLGVGLAATWYDRRGFYVDGQVTLTSYASDLSSDDGSLGTLIKDNSGTGRALSLEAGQQLDLGSRLTVIPQAQLSLSSVEFDDFAGGRYGEQVAFEEAVSQQLRLGLEFEAQAPQEGRHLYGIVNLFHEFGAGSAVEVAGASLTTEREPWAVGFGLGGSYALNDRVDFFGEASYATGLSNAGDTSALSASAGLKVMF